MVTAADRVEAFLNTRATMLGLDPDDIIGANHNRLTVADLRELVAAARRAPAAPRVLSDYAEEQGTLLRDLSLPASKIVGRDVVYLPAGDVTNRRLERGVITSMASSAGLVFVRYGDDTLAKATPTDRLYLIKEH